MFLTPYSHPNNTPRLFKTPSSTTPDSFLIEYWKQCSLCYDCSLTQVTSKPIGTVLQSQDFNFSQNPQSLQQTILVVTIVEVLNETFQCLQMMKTIIMKAKPCYDSNSFRTRSEHLKYSNEQTLHELIAQAIQKKRRKKRIAEEQAPKERYWKIHIYSFSSNDVEYVEASPPNSEPVSSKVMEIVIPEVGRIEDDILLIKDDTLRETLLNVNRLVAKIEALKDNPFHLPIPGLPGNVKDSQFLSFHQEFTPSASLGIRYPNLID
ncbi:hypothetical protein Tco_0313720 [Tanacetum coccineum]